MLRWTTLSQSAVQKFVPIRRAATRHTLTSTPQRVQHLRHASATAPPQSPNRWLARGTFYGLSFLVISHVFTAYFFSSDITYGISMLPTLHSFGDCVLISKYYRRGRGVKVGDVISFKHPVREGEYAVKRVIGMEGDFVLYNTPEKSEAMIQVPHGHCWVVGDNMKHSRDSRTFGPLPMALIHGKILARWSGGFLSDFAWMKHGLQPVGSDYDVD